jgi:hypothetical protein
MRYLLFEVYQGNENAPDAHTFAVGPFHPAREVGKESFSEASQFQRKFLCMVGSLNIKFGIINTPEQMMLVVEEFEGFLTEAHSPITPMREFGAIVEDWLKQHQPVAA